MISNSFYFNAVYNNYGTIMTCMRIKLAIFFVLTFILMAVFWYFVTAFCAVYTNTQIIMIIDSMGSFVISMVYPFVLYLIPAYMRYKALKDPQLRSYCLYKLSNVIPII